MLNFLNLKSKAIHLFFLVAFSLSILRILVNSFFDAQKIDTFLAPEDSNIGRVLLYFRLLHTRIKI